MKSSVPLSLDSMLVEGTAILDIHLNARQRRCLLAYLEYLIQWNTAYNLTAVRAPQRMLVQHILDSCAVIPVLASYPISSVLDVGSGGGLPGVVLAIIKPDWHLTLNDAVQKKTAFLTHLKTVLPLPNVYISRARVEKLPSNFQFSALISRAFSSLTKFVALSRHLAAQGASIWAMKGSLSGKEIAEFKKETQNKAHIVRVIKLDVPFLEAERNLVEIKLKDHV